MRLHPLCVVILMLLLVPSPSQAHDHVWDVAFGPAAASGSRLYGGRFSVGLTNKVPANRDLSWLFDVTYVKGKNGTDDITQRAYLVGGRYAVAGNRQTDRNVLMLHGLVGWVDKQKGPAGDGNFPVTLGAAYERMLSGGPAGWAARVQIDHTFLPKSGVKGFTQISAGIVHRFD